MKVEFWTRNGGDPRDSTRYVHAKCVWRGDLGAIPRMGDGVVVRDGFASETVKRIDWMLEEGASVCVMLDTCDPEGSYSEVELGR